MHLLRHLQHFPHLYRLIFALGLLCAAVPFCYLLWRYFVTRPSRPRIAKDDVLYRESFASGVSQRSLLTQFGGANACLRLIVTQDLLVITSWFPFSLLTPIYDLEHTIPRRSIVSLDDLQAIDRTGFHLIYTDSGGRPHSIHLFPKNRAAFRRALTLAPGNLVPSN